MKTFGASKKKEKTDKMSKISFSSRFYEPLRVLKGKTNARNLFKLIHNEDKGTYHFPYLCEGYENQIEPIKSSSKIIDSIKLYLDDNLFNNSERKLLIEELIPFVVEFGEHAIKGCSRINTIHEIHESQKKYISECNKTIDALKSTKQILLKELETMYLKIVGIKKEVEKPIKISKKAICAIGKELKIDIEKIRMQKEKIGEGETEESLTNLKKILKATDKYNSILQISSHFKVAQKNLRKNIIDYNQYEISISRVTNAVLDVIAEMELEYKDSFKIPKNFN